MTEQSDFNIETSNDVSLEIPRIVSPLFNVTFPEDNIFGAPAGMTKAVSDGNWVFLRPQTIVRR
jgi:hypothetical protein